MNISSLESEIDGYEGKKISYDLTYKPSNQASDLVIFCHGFKGFKDWGHWHLIAAYFVKEGFSFAKLNYSHNGVLGAELDHFNDLEGFARNTYSAELFDLNAFIDHMYDLSNDKFVNFSFSRIHLIGHSRSGPIVLRTAVKKSIVSSVITWASVHSMSYMWERDGFELQKWIDTGAHQIMNGRTKQLMTVNATLYHDYMANVDRYSIDAITEQLNKPVLILHGDKDPAVDCKSGHLLQTKLKNAKLEIIKNGDHVFGGKHPYLDEELPVQSLELCQRTIDFLKKG